MKPEKLSVVWASLFVGGLVSGCGGAQVAGSSTQAAAAGCEVPARAAEPVSSPVAVSSTPAASTEPAAASQKADHGPSCDGRTGAGNDCGSGESCCARAVVPEGDVLYRRYDAGPGEKKHVAAFALDKYEATVGRFRAWVAAGQPVPQVGEVIHDDGAGHQLKWPKSAKVQDEKHLEGWKRYDTWTGGDDKRPKNNISWFTAAAFCRWDGGRLPTDEEWTRATRGGEEDRAYPWGAEEPTRELAVYNCLGEGDGQCNLKDILQVGSKPKGVGKWGHLDLAGSMFEWTMSPGRVAGSDTVERARGGGFCYIGGVDRRATTSLRPAVFREESPETLSHMTGVRCAYDAGTSSPASPPASTGAGSADHAR